LPELRPPSIRYLGPLIEGWCTERATTDRRVKEVAEGGPRAPQVAVSQRVFGDEREAARVRHRTSGRL
jgi:hypothetical protein